MKYKYIITTCILAILSGFLFYKYNCTKTDLNAVRTQLYSYNSKVNIVTKQSKELKDSLNYYNNILKDNYKIIIQLENKLSIKMHKKGNIIHFHDTINNIDTLYIYQKIDTIIGNTNLSIKNNLKINNNKYLSKWDIKLYENNIIGVNNNKIFVNNKNLSIKKYSNKQFIDYFDIVCGTGVYYGTKGLDIGLGVTVGFNLDYFSK